MTSIQPKHESEKLQDKSLIGMIFAAAYLKRKPILIAWAIAFLGCFVFALLAQKQYTSSVTFQIRTESSSPLGIGEGLKMLGGKFKSDGTAVVLAVLDSRHIALSLIDQFHLKDHYKTKWDHLAIKRFRHDLEYESFDDGIVQLSFTHASKDTAKAIVDSVLAYVNKQSVEYYTRKARLEFEFNKKQVDSVYARMDSLRLAWTSVMRDKGLAELESNVELALRTYGMIEQASLEVEERLALAKVDDRVSPQERKNLEAQQKILKDKRAKLFTGTPRSEVDQKGKSFELSIPYDSIPSMLAWQQQMEFLAERDQLLLKILVPKLEESRLSMVELTPVLNVIDPSFIPPYKSGPKRALIIVFGTILLGTFVTLIMVLCELFRNPVFTFPFAKGLIRDVRHYG